MAESKSKKKKKAKNEEKDELQEEEEEVEEEEVEEEEVEEDQDAVEESEYEDDDEEEVDFVEEEEDEGEDVFIGPIPHLKPVLSEERRAALRLRTKQKKRNPNHFYRQEWFRYSRLGLKWRAPKGLHSKQRRAKKYRAPRPRIGWGKVRAARGLHPSGFEEIHVYRVADLKDLDPEVQAARIGGTVGRRKANAIIEAAREAEIRVLNPPTQYETFEIYSARELQKIRHTGRQAVRISSQASKAQRAEIREATAERGITLLSRRNVMRESDEFD